MTYTLEKAEEMARALRALPAPDASKRKLTKQAVVRHLAGEIATLQRRGYTIEQIVESLGGIGLEISTPTLKSYLQRAKAKASPAASRKQKEGKAPPIRRTAEEQPLPIAGSSTPPKGEVERSGKQAFLVKDKDSY